jgi:hypothetical protein
MTSVAKLVSERGCGARMVVAPGEDLPPGEYRLRVTVAIGRTSDTRELAFRLIE